MIVDLFLVYQMIKRLATPFKKWKAYEHGIIDEKGNILRKRKDLNKVAERESWGIYDIMISKLKRLLEKVPGGSTRLGTYAAALWLIKEHQNYDLETAEALNEETIENDLIECIDTVRGTMLTEDAPVVSAGGGAVAGIGIGPDGEPGVDNKKKKKKKKHVIKRFTDFHPT